MRWLIETGVLAKRGALGTDTFGPDPSADELLESFLTLNRHRFTLENLNNLGEMPATGGWIVIGGPANRHGSGAASGVRPGPVRGVRSSGALPRTRSARRRGRQRDGRSWTGSP